MSCTVEPPTPLKLPMIEPPNQAERKSKISCTVAPPMQLMSAGQTVYAAALVTEPQELVTTQRTLNRFEPPTIIRFGTQARMEINVDDPEGMVANDAPLLLPAGQARGVGVDENADHTPGEVSSSHRYVSGAVPVAVMLNIPRPFGQIT